MTPPRRFSALPPQDLIKASPKAISRRTSYLRVRLEFLRYPHLITTLFNGCVFGPPSPFTAASTWTWVGHPVSGLHCLTFALLRLGFPMAPNLKFLTCQTPQLAGPFYKKYAVQLLIVVPTACKHRVSGSLSLPSRGSFHLSFTVLCAIGH